MWAIFSTPHLIQIHIYDTEVLYSVQNEVTNFPSVKYERCIHEFSHAVNGNEKMHQF